MAFKGTAQIGLRSNALFIQRVHTQQQTVRRSFHAHAIRKQPAAAAASATASPSNWYMWGGGQDLKYAISGGVTGIGGLKKSNDPYFSRTAHAFAPAGLSIAQIAFGVFHTGIVTTDGELYMMGANNKRHCLGLGDKVKGTGVVRAPARLEGLPPIRQIALGLSHTIALGRDGSVWTWGSGGSAVAGGGALGHGEWTDSPTPKQIKINGFDKLKAVAVAAGHQHSMVVDGTCIHFSILLA